MSELDVHVTMAGSRVFLSGNVATAERREAVSAAVRRLVPDHDVYNEITVAAFAESDDEEEIT